MTNSFLPRHLTTGKDLTEGSLQPGRRPFRADVVVSKKPRNWLPFKPALTIRWHFAFAGGEWYLDSGQYDLFIERQLQRLELDSSFPQPYVFLGRVYTFKRMYEEAIPYLQKAVDLSETKNGPLSALGYTYAVSGKRNEALKILHQLTLSNAAPDQIAHVYVGLREKDRAFDWLQKAVADHRIRRGFEAVLRPSSLSEDEEF